jgi:putative photosynthetic complex assembly protein
LSEILEHDSEAAPGIPAPLPASERVLWRGGPDWKVLARSKFHLLKLAAYFVVVLVIYQVVQVNRGMAAADIVAGSLGFALLASVALGIVAAFARATARSTVFTVTNRRLIVRCGVALPLSMNLPFSKVVSAEYCDLGNGYGNIALLPAPDSRASYVLLWPYVRPWRLLRIQPMLRAIPDASYVADQLGKALEADAIERESRPPEPARLAPSASDAAEKPRRGERRWKPYPTVPLATAAGLVILTVIGTGIVSMTGNRPAPSMPSDVVASVDLRFDDMVDGSVNVVDAGSGEVLDTIEPGANGFLRSTLRGLALARTDAGGDRDTAFSLQQTSEGQLLLLDPVTLRSVDLWAFGETNAGTFVRYLQRAGSVRAGDQDDDRKAGGDTSVATASLTNQELTQ